MGEAEGVAAIGEFYVPLTIKDMITNLMSKLKELVDRDRIETAKILKFEKHVAAEEDEDIQAKVKSLLQKVSDLNVVTKSDVMVYKGKIQKAVEDLCRTHNHSVMEADERKRKAIKAEALKQKRPRITRMPLAEVAALDEGASEPTLVLLSSTPSIKPPAPDVAPSKRKICTITKVAPLPTRPPPPPRVATSLSQQPEAPLPTGSNQAS